MQYVFIRNFLSGEVVGRIYLDSFPTALSFNSKKLNLVVGHDGIFVGKGGCNFFRWVYNNCALEEIIINRKIQILP